MAVEKTTSKINDVAPIVQNPKPQRLTCNAYRAGEMLGISHNTIREMVRRGELPSLPGRNINIPLIAIERYLEGLAGGAR